MASIRKRIDSKGKPHYTVQIRRKGHKPIVETFSRFEDAKSWASKTEVKVERNVYFPEDEAARRTLGDAIDRYLKECATQKDKHERERQLEWWRRQLGALTLSQITPAKLSEGKSKLATEPFTKSRKRTKDQAGPAPKVRKRDARSLKQHKRSPATVNRYMSAISHLLTTAEREWQWISYNPVRRVAKLKEPRGRVRFLSDEERVALLKACRESSNRLLLTIVTLALLTGARRNELITLKWSQIDSKRKVAVLHETKNGDRRVLSLPGPAWEALQEHGKVRRLGVDFVFPDDSGLKPASIEEAWRAAIKAAQLEDFRFHDLRHSCASYLAMNGATPGEIAEVLGHRTLAMVKRYAHLSEQHVSSVVERMADSVFGPAASAPGKRGNS